MGNRNVYIQVLDLPLTINKSNRIGQGLGCRILTPEARVRFPDSVRRWNGLVGYGAALTQRRS